MSDDESAGPVEVSAIANPLASDKLEKKLYKVTKKGVKEVVKSLRKGEKGLCIIAGNISPIDVITHVPVLCEEAGVPYIYVRAKAELGAAASTKRPTSVVMLVISGEFEYKDKYDEIVAEVKKAMPKFT